MEKAMHLISIHIGMPKIYGDPSKISIFEREWQTGFYKEPALGSVKLTSQGIIGDGQADIEAHGGPNKAICVYPSEHFEFWRKEIALEMKGGAFGENFTISNVLETEVSIGDIFKVGDVIVQVTQPREPCWKLARRWKVKKLSALVQQSGRTGWYFRVLQEGEIKAPDKIELIERPHEEWTIEKCNRVMHHLKKDKDLASELASLPELSKSWQTSLLNRVHGGKISSEEKRLYGEQ